MANFISTAAIAIEIRKRLTVVQRRGNWSRAVRGWPWSPPGHGDQPTNFFWSSHDNNATRRTYLMAEIKNNYSGIDFEGYKRTSDRFAAIWASLNPPPAPKKVKVKY